MQIYRYIRISLWNGLSTKAGLKVLSELNAWCFISLIFLSTSTPKNCSDTYFVLLVTFDYFILNIKRYSLLLNCLNELKNMIQTTSWLLKNNVIIQNLLKYLNILVQNIIRNKN